MLWKISQQPDPGTMDDFYEGLKVKYFISWSDYPCLNSVFNGTARNNDNGSLAPTLHGPPNFLQFIFQVFDNDGQGKVHISALTRALTGLADKMTDKQVDQLAEGLMDQNGDIKIVDFIAKCTSD